MPNTLPCSCLIIAKDAADTIARCIASVQFCEQILVGDDGSSDETIEIARSVGADVVKLKKTDSFANKRNELTQYSQHEWVLWIDSDEVVTSQLHDALDSLFSSNLKSQTSAFCIRRMDVFLGRRLQHGETAHTWLLRLGKKEAGRWERSVHETWHITGKIGQLDGEILHYSHPDLEEFFDKINHYTELEVEERRESSKQQVASSMHEFFQKKLSTYYSLLTTYTQLFIFPIAKFIQNYFFRLGCLDGFPGFVMAYMMSLHSLIVRIKVLEKV